jgi:hypothetical protein
MALEAVGPPPDLRVHVQRHFFGRFAISQDLVDESVDVSTGAVVELGERGLVALGGLGDELTPFPFLDAPKVLHRDHRHGDSPSSSYERKERVGFICPRRSGGNYSTRWVA